MINDQGETQVGLLFAKGEKESGTLSRRLLDLAAGSKIKTGI
jgi:hypothetical protein